MQSMQKELADASRQAACPDCGARVARLSAMNAENKKENEGETDMQKTKLGISVGLLGAAIYFMGLFSGYMVAVLLAGYVLLFEEDQWLKKSAVKAIAVMVFFSLLIAVANLVPNAISVIDSIVSMFGGNFHIAFLSNLINAVVAVLNIIQKLLLLGLGMSALGQGTIAVPIVDGLVDKYMG